VHDNGWSKDLTVEVDGHGVVSHTGSAALRLLADNTGLTGGLSRALAHRGFIPVHDRGRVLGDLAVCIADGGRVLSDLAALRDQAELSPCRCGGHRTWECVEPLPTGPSAAGPCSRPGEACRQVGIGYRRGELRQTSGRGARINLASRSTPASCMRAMSGQPAPDS
jgi:hypothetical protein